VLLPLQIIDLSCSNHIIFWKHDVVPAFHQDGVGDEKASRGEKQRGCDAVLKIVIDMKVKIFRFMLTDFPPLSPPWSNTNAVSQ